MFFIILGGSIEPIVWDIRSMIREDEAPIPY